MESLHLDLNMGCLLRLGNELSSVLELLLKAQYQLKLYVLSAIFIIISHLLWLLDFANLALRKCQQ